MPPTRHTRQSRLEVNAEAIERWQRRLFRAANELQKLATQRKRLLGPMGKAKVKYYRSLDEIREQQSRGGSEFTEDNIPL